MKRSNLHKTLTRKLHRITLFCFNPWIDWIRPIFADVVYTGGKWGQSTEPQGLQTILTQFSTISRRLLLTILLLSQTIMNSYALPKQLADLHTIKAAIYHYDNFSRLASTKLSNGLKEVYQYNDHNQLVALKYYRDDTKQPIVSFSYQYDHQGNIIDRLRQDSNGQQAQEEYAYDNDDNLADYHCQGTLCPRDQLGNQIRSQHYQFDAVNNISQVRSTLLTPKGKSLTNTATYLYDKVIPTRLTGYENSIAAYNQKIQIRYDHDGNITQDDQGNQITYGPSDQTLSVTTAHAKITYSTDGNHIQVGEQVQAKEPGQTQQSESQYFIYGQGQLLNTQQNNGQWTSYLYGLKRLGQDDNQGVQYDLTDQGGSVIETFGTSTTGQPILLSASLYSPYGIETPLQISQSTGKKKLN